MFKSFNYKIKYAIFYVLIFFAIFLVVRAEYPTEENHVNLCIFHYVTGYACAACGTGRSLIYLKFGEFYKSLLTNPIGYLVLGFGILSLVWMTWDIIKKKETFFKALNVKLNPFLIGIIAILTIANWIWNIYKGL